MKVYLLAFGFVIAVFSNHASTTEYPEKPVTLYRSSLVDPNIRVHVATFDAENMSLTYNSENCEIAAQLFENQLGVTVKYWCEPGRYQQTRSDQ